MRFVAIIVLAIGVWWQSSESLRTIKIPLILLAALALWMAIQLIPLPPAWWHALPERETIVEIDRLTGLAETWRPITLSPLRTVNALGALTVPLAVLMLVALFDGKGWHRLQTMVLAIGLVSALLGIMQVALPAAQGLYFYQITNADSAVGLFSNRNHNALFLNIALVFSLFYKASKRPQNPLAFNSGFFAAQIVLVLAILVNGSRFGLLMLGVVFVVFAIKQVAGLRAKPKTRLAKTDLAEKLKAGAVAVFAIAFVGVFALMDRLPALDRLIDSGSGEELRARSFAYVIDILVSYFPAGAGFGAFEQAYRAVEPVELLGPAYFNHAHNDWIQFVLEGGAPAAILLIAAIAWLAFKFVQFLQVGNLASDRCAGHWAGFVTLGLFAIHSAFDYPLRTPLLMMIAIIAMMLAVRPVAVEGASSTTRQGRMR